MSTLEIKDLHASVNGTEILKGLSLSVPKGQVHAIMGPNGSGKSTLAKVMAGHQDYEVGSGDVFLDGKSLLEMDVDERSREGLFLAFQYPAEIPGVSNANFLRAARQARLPDGEEIDAVAFYQEMYDKMAKLGIDKKFTGRSVNEGFSGGEKKRNEVLQMMMLEPKYAVLDETDSGLDIDALKIVAQGVNAMRSEERGFLVITHYQRLLEYIVPDHVHVLNEGRIIRSGPKELALELEEKGYDWLKEGELVKS
ncbi:MAG: Fe-S cluster assembly ATPase SufC [Verrucomicrobiota bacterium]|nr:Fe-S cluster assembly ATPase SufC [Verrucomicrobiota bacterium]MEE3176387.1 Fe-S cluster assembly ATPase SufC [Verrucomicrobiota bacterium]